MSGGLGTIRPRENPPQPYQYLQRAQMKWSDLKNEDIVRHGNRNFMHIHKVVFITTRKIHTPWRFNNRFWFPLLVQMMSLPRNLDRTQMPYWTIDVSRMSGFLSSEFNDALRHVQYVSSVFRRLRKYPIREKQNRQSLHMQLKVTCMFISWRSVDLHRCWHAWHMCIVRHDLTVYSKR